MILIVIRLKCQVSTFRPASLLWRFIKARHRLLVCVLFFPFRLVNLCSRASTNVLEKLVPKRTLSEQPAHWNPSEDNPRMVRSQPQSSNSPAEQARVNACATPAAEMAWTKAASRVPIQMIRFVRRIKTRWMVNNTIVCSYLQEQWGDFQNNAVFSQFCNCLQSVTYSDWFLGSLNHDYHQSRDVLMWKLFNGGVPIFRLAGCSFGNETIMGNMR